MFFGFMMAGLSAIIYFLEKDGMIFPITSAIAYLSLFWGGSGWLFFYSLKGFRRKDITVIGDECAPETRYTGKPAQIYGIIGMALAALLFIGSLVPIPFLIR